jgi:hypothetical protein
MGIRVAYTNLLTATGVVLSSSADAIGYAVSNLANAARWKKWRSSTTTGDQWVKFDLGANKTLTVLAAISAKLHAGGTLKCQANATDVWTSPTVSDTLTVPSPDFTAVLADWIASQNLRWIRFYFTNVGAVSDYVELGAVFAGTYLEPTNTLAQGVMVTRVDPSMQQRATGGQRSALVRPKYHEVAGVLLPQVASARDDLRAMFETVGDSTPVILAVDPTVPGLIFYGALDGALHAQHLNPSLSLWEFPLAFREDVA